MKRYKVFSVWEYLLLFLFALLSLAFFYLSRQSLAHKAYQSLKNKKIEEARIYFQQAVEKEPSKLLNYLNLALSYDLNKQKKPAEEIYQTADSRFLDKDGASFFLYFNQGEFYSRAEPSPDKALQAYQKALEFDYKKDLVKKNIEWLFKDKKSQDNSSGNKEGRSNNKETADREKGGKAREGLESQNQRDQKTDSEDKSGGGPAGPKEESQEEGKLKEGQSNNKETEDREKAREEREGLESQNQRDQKKDSEDKSEGGLAGQKEESQEEGKLNNQGGAEDQKNPEKSNEAEEEESGQEKNQYPGGALKEEEAPEEDSLSKSFDFDKDIDEKAVLEEIQKQESKARSRFFKGKRSFGDKTDKNW